MRIVRPPLVPTPPVVDDPRLPGKRFVTPSLVLVVPDGLGRAPTSDDVEVRQGFDGRTPDEAVAVARRGCTSTVHPRNEAFVEKTLRDNHKAFTLAVNNAFIPNAPFQQLVTQFPGAKLTVVGTMSSLNPVLVKVEQPNQEPVYLSRQSGTYQPIAPMSYPVVMQAVIRQTPPGVALSYPKWSAPQLIGETCTISESN